MLPTASAPMLDTLPGSVYPSWHQKSAFAGAARKPFADGCGLYLQPTQRSYTREVFMKRLLFVLCFLLAGPAFAQQAVPQIPFRSVPDFLKLPAGHVSRRSLRRRGQFQGTRLRLLARQHHRPGLRRRRGAASRVRCRRQVHSRDRPQPLRMVLRAHRARSTRKTTSGSPTRVRTWSSSSIPKAAW